MKRWLALMMPAAAILGLQACGNAPPTVANTSATSTGEGALPSISPVSGLPPVTVVKETDELKFLPASVTVRVGDVVEWQNSGTTPHNVTFDNGPHSATMNGGDAYEARFAAPGTYHYECTFHAPAMAGAVVVTR